MDRKHVEVVVGATLFVVLALLLILPCQFFAQGVAGTATLTGQVTDPSGALMAGVELSLMNVGEGTNIKTASNQAGYYEFASLRPTTYVLTAKVKGFGDVTIPNINLEVSQTSTINISMKPGAVVQEITVSGAAVALETQTSSAGGVVSQVVEQQLPIILRDTTSLVNLVPGVTSDHRLTGAADSSGLTYAGRLDFEINGGYRSQAVSMVDGVDVTVVAGDFDSMPITPTPDFTQEFKVQTNALGPEFGRGIAVLNIVTRSGTNAIHGALFEFVQNNIFNSEDLFSNSAGLQKAAAKRNQFGGAVGGPVYIPHLYDGRNKTFWFVNVEQMRQRTAEPVAAQVPDAAERQGDFSNDYALNGDPITIYNPNAPFQNVGGTWMRPAMAGNKVPTSQWLDPTYVNNIFGYFPMPNNPGLLGPAGQYTGINNYRISGSAPLTWNRYDVKVDENIANNQRLMFRFSRSLDAVAPLNFFNNAATAYGYTTRADHQPGYNAVLSYTWTVAPTTVVTAAVTASHLTDVSVQPLFNETSLGGPFANGVVQNYLTEWTGGAAFPNLTFGNYAYMGNGFGQNFAEPYANYGLTANITNIRGKHTLKAGVQIEALVGSDNLFEKFGGTINYSGSWTNGPNVFTPTPNTGNGIADFLFGLDSSASTDAAFASVYTDKYIAGYFGDDFRVTPKLTLNLGVRYEVSTPFVERHNHEWRFDPNALNPIGNAIGSNTGGQTINQVLTGLGNRTLQGVVEFPSSPGVEGRGMVPVDWSNLSPRIGMAYLIRPKLVFRAAFAKLYGLSPDAPGPSTPGNGTFGAITNSVTSIDGVHPYTNTDNPWPTGFNVPTYATLGDLSLLGQSMEGGATGNVTPYQWQYNAGFQYELPGNTLLGINYAGSQGHRLTCAFFECGDQIPANLIQQYGATVNNSVPNPFYGIITNPTVGLSAPTVQMGQLLKQWPAYGGWTAVLPPWQGPDPNHDTFQSEFNALEVQINKRLSHGLTLMVAYTYSKLLTNSDSFEAGYLGPVTGYQNLVTYQGERSLGAADVTHRLVIGHVYDLPFGKGLRFGSNMPSVVDKMVGHWQFSGMSTFQSGFPLGISEAGHTTGAFGGGDRPDEIAADGCGGLSRSRGQKILQYLNPNAFLEPPNYTFGNAPRNLNGCRADGVKNFDWGGFKFFPINDKFKFEFRAEFYNTFNRPELGNPNTTFNSAGFGSITSQANSPRVIQLGLKLDF